MRKGDYRYPFPPYPSGWFAIGDSAAVTPEQVSSLSYFGRELIAFRNSDGSIAVLDAYCPHLGAHLGVGGALHGDCIECPFHGWRFDSGGRCIGIPYSDHIPERGKLHAYPTLQWAGLLIAWFSPDNAPPAWTPDLPAFDTARWTLHGSKRWTARVHVQEIGENGLDMPHFKKVHSADIPDMVRAEGVGRKFFISVKPKPDSAQAKYLHGIDRTLWGLGISMNAFEGAAPAKVVITRTPVDEQLSEITVVFVPKNQRDEKATAQFGELLMARIASEVEQDIPIWENKRYAQHPALTKGDGPIAAWRNWCQQFYAPDA